MTRNRIEEPVRGSVPNRLESWRSRARNRRPVCGVGAGPDEGVCTVNSRAITEDGLSPPDTAYTARWAGIGQVRQIALPNGFCLRYLRDGTGPPLLLLHTARSQLDYFQRLIPRLRDRFTVHAVDLPGHGWSTIRPAVTYDEPLLRATIQDFIDALALEQVTLVGDSIGAVLALTVAAAMPERVRRAIAVNLYDYPGGVRRANALAWAVIGAYRLPGLGALVSNMENLPILRAILTGGVADRAQLPGDLLREFRRVGRRPGYPRMIRSLFSALPSFIAARDRYPMAGPPVTIVYGASDWSLPEERLANHHAMPAARMLTLEDTGHFASLERPDGVARAILDGA